MPEDNDQINDVQDDGVNQNTDDNAVADTDNNQQSENEVNPVPYSRFKEVNDGLKQTKTENETLKAKLEELSTVVSQIKASSQPQTNENSWDVRAQKAESWDKFVSDIQEDTFRKWETRQQEADRKAEEQLNNEIGKLKDMGLNDSDVNAVMKFAVEKARKSGINDPIPLDVAYTWWNDTKPKTNPSKEVSEKVQSSKSTDGGTSNKAKSYKDIRDKSLDDIISEAQDKLSSE